MTVSHSAQMLLKLEKCIPISHVTLETVPKYANIERPTSSQLYASLKCVLREIRAVVLSEDKAQDKGKHIIVVNCYYYYFILLSDYHTVCINE